ncbi:MAG: LLM class flavin-dependent oxidoreductase [Anaerolineae bacterium]|nr:LLM class flavin-dependent oxidoreductase [Anaerolineae bacterium]
MKFALYLPNLGPYADPRTLANLAHDAENAGWDGFFIWDHIAREFLIEVVDPWVSLAAIAMSTEKMTIGALVTPLPRRRPWMLAKETAALDHLSGGRLIFGAGLGTGRPVEWANFGEEIDPRVRGVMLDEGLDILSGLWSGQPFRYEGAYYQVEESQFLPPTRQQPRIPIWVAGYWPNKAPMRRAARWDGVFPLEKGNALGIAPLETFKGVVEYVSDQRAALGLAGPFEFVHRGTSAGDRTQAIETAAQFAEAGATWWVEHMAPTMFGADWLDEWPVAQMHELVLQGPPRIAS